MCIETDCLIYCSYTHTVAALGPDTGTLTFQGHVTSSVTWPLDSRWSISYWWSFGPKSLSLADSEILRPNIIVLIDTMLYRHCACAYHVTCTPYVKFKYIFQFFTPTLPIHYVTFIELRLRIRGVLSVTSNVKGQNEQKICKSNNLQNFDLLGGCLLYTSPSPRD